MLLMRDGRSTNGVLCSARLPVFSFLPARSYSFEMKAWTASSIDSSEP